MEDRRIANRVPGVQPGRDAETWHFQTWGEGQPGLRAPVTAEALGSLQELAGTSGQLILQVLRCRGPSPIPPGTPFLWMLLFCLPSYEEGK